MSSGLPVSLRADQTALGAGTAWRLGDDSKFNYGKRAPLLVLAIALERSNTRVRPSVAERISGQLLVRAAQRVGVTAQAPVIHRLRP